MHPVEIEACLRSMEIIVDTREQPSEAFKKRCASFGVPWHRQKLNYGDYTYNFRLPDGEMFFPDDIPIGPDVVIERKMSLDELAHNFCEKLKDCPDARQWNHDHADQKVRNRFEYEFLRTKQAEAKVYLLVEGASFENLYNHKYRSKFPSKSFAGSLFAFCSRYDMGLAFCRAETSGKLIHDILYYELRERLEGGVYG